LQRKTTERQDIEDPKLPRKQKAPARREIGALDTHYSAETTKDHYREVYYSAIDTVTQCITSRFDQEDLGIYQNIQELILKSIFSEPYETDLAEGAKTFGEDVDPYNLEGQLALLPKIATKSMGLDPSNFDVSDLVTFYQSLDSFRKIILSEVCILGKLILVMPATNAVIERSFSALKRVRATTGDSRLNRLMILHVHKGKTDAINLVDVANDFVGEKANRKQLFGKFSTNDVPIKPSFDEIDTNSGTVNSVSICMYACMLYDLLVNA